MEEYVHENNSLVIEMRGFKAGSDKELVEMRRAFWNKMLEDKLVLLRKQIRLDMDVDYAITNIERNEGKEVEFSLVRNTVEDFYFQEETLYRMIERREGASGSIYDIMRDASKVRMYYIRKEQYNKHMDDLARRELRSGPSNPNTVKKIFETVKTPSEEKIKKNIIIVAARFMNAVNNFAEEYFKGQEERPRVIQILGMSVEEFNEFC